jgi:hypothetical protein
MRHTRIRSIVSIGASALTLSACGSTGSPAASRPDPPTPTVLSAIVSASQLRLSPDRIGAGPVLLTITNQSSRSVAVLVHRSGSSGAVARTAPLNPQGVTQLKVDLSRGTYTVAAAPSERRTDAQASRPAQIATARLRITRSRASSGGQVLQP